MNRIGGHGSGCGIGGPGPSREMHGSILKWPRGAHMHDKARIRRAL